jgi:hypothetical protein
MLEAGSADLPCPLCDHPRAVVLLDGISCPMCGLSLPTNDEGKYGLTSERWLSLGRKPVRDEAAGRGGDAAPGPAA